MKIEIWSDFVCPFCYVGKRQLELALDGCSFKENVIIEYKSFEIYSTSNHNESKKLIDILSKRHDFTADNMQNVIERAKEVGLLYKFDMLMHVNTFNAHRLMKYACTKNRSTEVVERFLKGYFIKKEQINDYHTLMTICEELSFDKREVDVILQSNKYSKAVKCDQLEADEIGIKQTPFFLFNEELAISGIQSIEIFKEAIELTWESMGRTPVFTAMKKDKSKTTYCSGDHCEG